MIIENHYTLIGRYRSLKRMMRKLARLTGAGFDVSSIPGSLSFAGYAEFQHDGVNYYIDHQERTLLFVLWIREDHIR